MSAYSKDVLREITHTIGRYLSLVVITMLGAYSVVGIQATAIDMRDSADKLFKERHLYDLQIKSATGFDGEDISALLLTDGVKTVDATHTYDFYIYVGNEIRTIRTFAIPTTLNDYELVEGRMPQDANECAVEQALLDHWNLKIGDSISLGLDDMDDYHDVLDDSELTIVGVATAPFFLMPYDRGHTSLGSGTLDYYLYLAPHAYKLDVYTDAYILMAESLDIFNLSDEYNATADGWQKLVEPVGDLRVQAKLDEYADAQKDIDDGWQDYNDGVDELNDKVADGQKDLDDAKAQLDDSKAQLEEGQKELDDKIAAALAQIEAGEAVYGSNPQFDAARAQTEQERAAAQADIDAGWTAYNEGLKEWEDGTQTLADEEADGQAKLDDAKNDLEDAQSKLDDAPEPEWFYFLRKDEAAFDSYYQDTLRLQSIGYVFPMVFFIVAILVSLTTMSRMVDENRTQIGIYKALGYRPISVIMKYLIYAFSAGVIGGVLGVVSGCNIFPRVIYGAYMHLYDMPPIAIEIPPDISTVAIAAAVGAVVIVTFATCLNSLRDTPATLMRPKAPPSGKRVLIERIPFIWNHLHFISKVTARNIFRYKKRFVMTLAGVMGCTALLLTSFGLRNSLAAVAGLQYGKLAKYTERAYLKDITDTEQRGEIEDLLKGADEWLFIREESITAEGSAFLVTMIIPETAGRMADYIVLETRRTGVAIPLTDDGVLVTEKLARDAGLTVGGDLTFTDSDGSVYTAKINGIVENYVLHHVYISPNLYEQLTGDAPLYNSVLLMADDATASTLLEDSNVRAVISTAYLRDNIGDSTDALEVVAIVLIVLACMLAFVVLFNLTNINITERVRELATIKVLGFYNEELSMYIYRENAVVTLIGIILGLIGGIFLHDYVLTGAEIDLLMFPHIIKPMSYVYSAALTVAFAVFVNLVMNIKLARIDMVESLKNVE